MDESIGEFVEHVMGEHGDEFDLNVFNFVLEQERAEGLDDMQRDVQAAAFRCSSAAVLAWLMREGYYNASRNTASSLVTYGNEMGLKLLLGQGFDVNAANEEGEQPLTQATFEMADVLLRAGAKIERLTGTVLPWVGSLKRMLQFDRVKTMTVFSADVLISLWCRHNDSQWMFLPLLKLMRKFDYPAPDLSRLHPVCQEKLSFALFTFQFTSVRPRRVLSRSQFYGDMLWRPHTHYACDDSTRARVMTALLCLKRICSRLPRDLRNVLLLKSFGSLRICHR